MKTPHLTIAHRPFSAKPARNVPMMTAITGCSHHDWLATLADIKLSRHRRDDEGGVP